MPLITPFDPWKGSWCSCPAKLSLGPYTGCAHGCLYCYASSYIVNFSAPRPKKDFIRRLAREIRKIPSGSHIAIANSCDPYQPLEAKLLLSRRTLEMLADCRLKVSIVTKSDLITRDSDVLKKMKQTLVCISITTLNERLAKKIEPNAPSPEKRLAAIAELSGILPVAVRFDPLIYPLTTAEITQNVKIFAQRGARQIITSTYKIKPDNFKRMTKAFPEHRKTWQELYREKGEKGGGYRYLAESLRQELIERVRAAALDSSLRFSSCREGLACLNTASCDGSALLTDR